VRKNQLSGWSRVYLRRTIFTENNLSTVKGLIEIKHGGPSHVSLHTVKLPQDGSALHFLRGAGIPDEWIDFYRGTIMNPIQYHSCFISYSSPDDILARRLHADLQEEGVRCWFAPHDLQPGDYFRKRIDEAIHIQDKLLLILSEHSVKSGWVGYEVETALNREIRQKREILFPLRIDDAVFPALPIGQSHSEISATLETLPNGLILNTTNACLSSFCVILRQDALLQRSLNNDGSRVELLAVSSFGTSTTLMVRS
jgi:hypothetical protein